jgi:homeodomain-containing protein
VKKYVVRLTEEERTELLQMIRAGRSAARTLTHAHILLKADAGAEVPAWTGEAIAAALTVDSTTVARVRQRLVEQGLEAALRPKPTRRPYERKLDGRAEAHLIALACSPTPAGQARWTLRLLADKLVELEQVRSISRETVRQTLKKRTAAAPEAILVDSARAQCGVCRADGRRAGGLPTLL